MASTKFTDIVKNVKSSDDEDSDDERSVKRIRDDEDDDEPLGDDSVKISQNLNIVEHKEPPKNKKFSVWSDLLLDEELSATLSGSLASDISRKQKRSERSVESYNFPVAYKSKKPLRKPSNMTPGSDFDKLLQAAKNAASKGNEPNPAKPSINRNRKRKKNKLKASQMGKKGQATLSKEGITAQMIATGLREHNVDLIRKTVDTLGCENALRLCQKVLDVEVKDGMMTADGKRRRTPGGVFFHLMKADELVTAEQRQMIFGHDHGEKRVKRRGVRRLKQSPDITEQEAKITDESALELLSISEKVKDETMC